MYTANVNVNTGIPFGIIAANYLDLDLVSNLQMNGSDLTFSECMKEEFGTCDKSELDDNELARFNEWLDSYDSYDSYEPMHEGIYDGVYYMTTWLGGALHIVIMESPQVGKFKRCSPCVPGAGDLSSPDESGYDCYTVPENWYDEYYFESIAKVRSEP